MWNAHGAGTNSARNAATNAISTIRSTMCRLAPAGSAGGGALPREPAWNVRRFIRCCRWSASRCRRPLRLRSFRQAEVDVRAAAQDAGHVIGIAAHDPPELVDAPGGQIALDAGHADRAGAGPVVVEERRAHAEDPLRVLLVIDGEAKPPDRGQV